MARPKILIFAPREEPPEAIKALETLGCEVVIGNRDWQLPRTTYEDDVVAAARDAVALVGTSMRHTPISRRIMQASQRLRVVAKYTVASTTSTPMRRRSSASWFATRRPNQTASASPRLPSP